MALFGLKENNQKEKKLRISNGKERKKERFPLASLFILLKTCESENYS